MQCVQRSTVLHHLQAVRFHVLVFGCHDPKANSIRAICRTNIHCTHCRLHASQLICEVNQELRLFLPPLRELGQLFAHIVDDTACFCYPLLQCFVFRIFLSLTLHSSAQRPQLSVDVLAKLDDLVILLGGEPSKRSDLRDSSLRLQHR